MKDLRNILPVIIVLMFFGILAYYELAKYPKEHTINPRLTELQDSLAQSRAEKQQLEQALKDSNLAHQARYQALISDTANHTLITRDYDGIRKEHQSLEVDSAVDLAHHRLRIEPQYGSRFDYSYLPN